MSDELAMSIRVKTGGSDDHRSRPLCPDGDLTVALR